MMKYNIYAGMGGEFGGAQFVETVDFPTLDDANQYAYDQAWEEYEFHADCYDILNWIKKVYDKLKEAGELDGMTDNEIRDFVNTHYQEEVENWIEWYAEPYVEK